MRNIPQRFTEYVGSKYGTGNAFWVENENFYNQTQLSTGLVVIESSSLPISGVVADSPVLIGSSIMSDCSTGIHTIDVYRYDHRDAKPINVDRYNLITNAHQEPNYSSLVYAMTTGNANDVEDFFSCNSILYKIEHKEGHWLNIDEVPLSIRPRVEEKINYFKQQGL